MIEVRNLWKRYAGVTALGGISLTVEKGRVMGILGENGSGKSTLFKILAGVAHASEGSASISGQPVGVQTRRITSYLPRGQSVLRLDGRQRAARIPSRILPGLGHGQIPRVARPDERR